MNEPRRRGPIARVFVGLWTAMNFTRRLFFNVLFFGLLIVLVVAMFASGRVKPMMERTTLVIAPEGRIVEQYSGDPASRALSKLGGGSSGEVQLRDILRALDAARTDKAIERVVVRTDKLQPSGLAPLRDIAVALQKVRAAGKQVIAYSRTYGQGDYLIAAQADEVYADPMGEGVMLTGLASYNQYFGEVLQDKLGIDMQVFKVGEFKSAVEPYIYTGASPEAKEADLFWMGDLWNRHLQDIAKARKIDPATLAAGVDGLADGVVALKGDVAQYSLQQKLIDGLKTRQEIDAMLVERGVADEEADGGYRQIGLDAYVAHVTRGASAMADARPQVAVVVAEGVILDGEQPPGSVGGDSTAALLREARTDEQVKAVVLRVNSPGGSALASEEIRREVAALQAAGKPVVASMGNVAASGGYWISMDADRIYADPSTITGSIGVFAVIPNLTRALDKVGVHTDGVATTRYAAPFDLTRPMEPDVARVIQAGVEKTYASFIERVAAGRKKPVAAVDAVARGRVWSGAQARERGLVDDFGGLDAAVADAAKRAELGDAKDWNLRYIEKVGTPFSQFVSGMAGTRIGGVLLRDSDLLRALLVQASPQMDMQRKLLQQAVQSAQSGRPTALAYCTCAF